MLAPLLWRVSSLERPDELKHKMHQSASFSFVSSVAVVSKSFEGQTDQTEEWYGTQYKQEAISDATVKVLFWCLREAGMMGGPRRTLLCSLFQKWADADLNGKFKLPMKNEFIPTSFEIYPLEKESPSVPTLIKASVPAVIWK